MASSVQQRVRKRREALRAAGLRPVQIWVPDTRASGFSEECRRQSRLVAAADADDRELWAFMDAALADLAGDAECEKNDPKRTDYWRACEMDAARSD